MSAAAPAASLRRTSPAGLNVALTLLPLAFSQAPATATNGDFTAPTLMTVSSAATAACATASAATNPGMRLIGASLS